MIKNKSKNNVVASSFKLCDSLLSKATGLMFRNKVKTPLVFRFGKEKKHGLHMFFVFCSIDVLFLDKRKKVVDAKESFKPFELYTPKKKCNYIVELGQGSIKKSRTQIGDEIKF